MGKHGHQQPDNRLGSSEIAMCGLSAACAVLILMIGFYLTFGEFFWYFCAGLAVDLPRTKLGKLCAYGVSVVLAVILCGFGYVYLAAYAALMGPYAAVYAATKEMPRIRGQVLRALFAFAGLMVVMWFTPMFFVQLSVTDSTTVRLAVILITAAAALPAEMIYAKLFGFASGYLRKQRRA